MFSELQWSWFVEVLLNRAFLPPLRVLWIQIYEKQTIMVLRNTQIKYFRPMLSWNYVRSFSLSISNHVFSLFHLYTQTTFSYYLYQNISLTQFKIIGNTKLCQWHLDFLKPKFKLLFAIHIKINKPTKDQENKTQIHMNEKKLSKCITFLISLGFSHHRCPYIFSCNFYCMSHHKSTWQC